MSTNSVSPAQSGASGGADEVDGASQPCPLKECAALVYCLDGSYMAVKGIDAEVVGEGGPKATDEQGTAEFLHLKPPNKDYTANVTLKGDSLKKYVWSDTEEASTATLLFHVEKFFVSFQLKDQFDQDISGLDWVLRYPDGKQKDSGKFGDSDKGTVKKDQVPKGDYIFAVQVVFDPEWAETD